MKKTLLLAMLCGLAFMANAQEASVEKSIFGLKTGFLGFWGHNEARLSDNIAFRTELGFDAGLSGSGGSIDGFVMLPVLNLEPRWYYNLQKRSQASKSTEGNSGNFLSLKTSFHPDLFVISTDNHGGIDNQLAIIPTWGIRRQLGSQFNYEAGFGLGYRQSFAGGGGAAVNLHLRIGYNL